ncbi:MAG: sulfurtransferase TusA family protein [Actinobacteria bacterium]|nr:sulfurtransferase TusA family protein [Actinomycetota bacterium]
MSRWFGRPDASTPSPVTSPVRPAVAVPRAPDGAAADGPLVTIDALGRKCPIPIIMLAQRIGEVPIGSVIAVLADDPAAETDVPSWCMMKSHDHVRTVPLERGWAILIRRGY